MAEHKTVVIDGKVVHVHEFDDGSTMVTGLDEVTNKEEKNHEENLDLVGARKRVVIPYILTAILISLPTLVVIGAIIYAIFDVMLNGYTYRV